MRPRSAVFRVPMRQGLPSPPRPLRVLAHGHRVPSERRHFCRLSLNVRPMAIASPTLFICVVSVGSACGIVAVRQHRNMPPRRGLGMGWRGWRQRFRAGKPHLTPTLHFMAERERSFAPFAVHGDSGGKETGLTGFSGFNPVKSGSSCLNLETPSALMNGGRRFCVELKQSYPGLKQSGLGLEQSGLGLEQSYPGLEQSYPGLEQSYPGLEHS